MANNSVSYLVFLLLVFVLAISEIASAEGKICEKPSLTWTGNCEDTDKCDKKCNDWEGAKHGACHVRESKPMCFCYFDCDREKNTEPPPRAPRKMRPAPSPEYAPPPYSEGGAPPSSGGEQGYGPPPSEGGDGDGDGDGDGYGDGDGDGDGDGGGEGGGKS
ncbi:hypothetical protein M8C21_001609 [Ambrosia artemisiifolia]|uniref:Knottins-like domain-containing protein n=1 Tax=Ambrosia artemisiifolia TaxID=4212 RepID=A0AAD5C8R0_AMBAR|nr:hypothetical protein M8C21_001609 [Ambrosia artemisiifolia]